MSLEQMTISTFRGLEGTTFRLNYGGATPLDLHLTNVAALPVIDARDGLRAEPFSLEFHSDGSSYALQGTYRLAHDQLGEFDLFIVPLGPADGGMNYQAIFN